jgi:hypothetical protein
VKPEDHDEFLCIKRFNDDDILCGDKAPKKYLEDLRSILSQAEEIHPGTIDFMVDNKVVLLGSLSIIRNRSAMSEGMSVCHRPDYKLIAIPEKGVGSSLVHARLKTFFHELAHCKEDVNRVSKGLPTLDEKTGGWIPYIERKGKPWESGSSTTYGVTPWGHEIRAEKFAGRMEKKGYGLH